MGSTSSNLGGKMGSTSSSHSRLISRSNSTVGVGNQGLNVQVEGSSIASGGGSHNRGSSSNKRGSSNLGGQMGSPSSSHSRLISRSNSTIGMGNQGLNVQVKGSS